MDKTKPCIDKAYGSRKNPLHDNSRVINHARHRWRKGRYLPSQKQSIKQTGRGGGARKGLASPQKNNGKGIYLMYLATSHLLQLHACRFKLFGLIYI